MDRRLSRGTITASRADTPMLFRYAAVFPPMRESPPQPMTTARPPMVRTTLPPESVAISATVRTL